MDAIGPRTIRSLENPTPEQAGAQVNPQGSGQQGTGDPGNGVASDNTPRTVPSPSSVARVAGQAGDAAEQHPDGNAQGSQDGGQDTRHAQRHPLNDTNDAGASAQASGGNQTNPPPTTASRHAQFETIVGRGGYENLNYRIRKAHKWHTYQYWFVAITSNSLLFLQVLIAASLTALGAFNDRRARTATIFLGATNTIIAALLTYFKTRNQPNRARQLRNDLGRVVDQLDDAEANLRSADAPDDVRGAIKGIRDSYRQARADAEANYPDLWVRAGDVRNPFDPDRKDNPSASTTLTLPGQSGQQGQQGQSGQSGQPGLPVRTDASMSGARNDPQASSNARSGP
ncbi:hypothetical protein LTR84_000631 [Exophiala bonariae]|uniref:SMODS and SLOG-associating 2TM effector domain-containing protein n=1 Tax=Exophiala bonariae TaxID=1690606 RepID=A0AAV9NRF9_9EURO|nr:hypothetical protein LTR84_000631 [Exophiala bonariae]